MGLKVIPGYPNNCWWENQGRINPGAPYVRGRFFRCPVVSLPWRAVRNLTRWHTKVWKTSKDFWFCYIQLGAKELSVSWSWICRSEHLFPPAAASRNRTNKNMFFFNSILWHPTTRWGIPFTIHTIHTIGWFYPLTQPGLILTCTATYSNHVAWGPAILDQPLMLFQELV